MNGEAMKVTDQPIDVQLAQFRAAHPLAHCLHTEEIWRYRRVGRGKDAVLWLTGARGVAELAFQSLLAIGPQFTVIAPDYPSTPTLDAFCDGLIAILNQERIERAHVVGGSLGGMIAQHLIRRSRPRSLAGAVTHGGSRVQSVAPWRGSCFGQYAPEMARFRRSQTLFSALACRLHCSRPLLAPVL